jgi:hypothetical protein
MQQGAQTARVTADAVLPRPGGLSSRARATATKAAIGALAAGVLVLGGVALHAAGRGDADSSMTVAELDATLGITPAGSRVFDRAPDAVLQSALDRETGDSAGLRASGLPLGTAERFGVTFTAADRAGADHLAALLGRTTGFTVAVAAPTARGAHWSVGAITAKAPLTVAVVHQLTERMTEAAWRSGGVRFEAWRVVSR